MSNNKNYKPMAYTMGEPAGIGADIILRLASQQKLNNLICIGDRQTLVKRAQQIGLSIRLVDDLSEVAQVGDLGVLDIPVAHPNPSQPLIDNVDGIMTMLDAVILGCLKGDYSAMVTGPIHKEIIAQKHKAFCGHTEYLGQKTQTLITTHQMKLSTDFKPVMLLASDKLKVALLTTHIPLNTVSQAITKPLVLEIVTRIHDAFINQMGINQPKILVCGLNPHAGEDGLLGREEIEVITPALNQLRQHGIDVEGPLSADTIFSSHNLQRADVFLAMYHDQGLPVLKTLSFGQAANITLGLPIIRTSVDHGTAFDLVGSDSVDLGSLNTAIRAAKQMIEIQLSNHN